MRKSIFQNLRINTEGIYCGRAVLDTPERTLVHDHDYYEVFIMLQGSMLHVVNGSIRPVHTNTVVFVSPQTAHCFERLGLQEAVFVNFAFSPRTYREICLLMQLETLFYLKASPKAVLGEAAARLIAEKIQALGPAYNELTRFKHAQKTTIVMELLLAVAQAGERKAGEPAPLWLDEALREMDAPHNMAEGLKRLVALSGKSQEHVNRCMQKYYQSTPTAYINRLRMLRAAELLLNTTQPVTEILFQVGCSNVSHFNALFKRAYGVCPSEYRKQVQSALETG